MVIVPTYCAAAGVNKTLENLTFSGHARDCLFLKPYKEVDPVVTSFVYFFFTITEWLELGLLQWNARYPSSNLLATAL